MAGLEIWKSEIFILHMIPIYIVPKYSFQYQSYIKVLTLLYNTLQTDEGPNTVSLFKNHIQSQYLMY